MPLSERVRWQQPCSQRNEGFLAGRVSLSGALGDSARVVETPAHCEAAAMRSRDVTYPVPYLRVVLLIGLGLSLLIFGVIESVGRGPPMWAALVVGVGAVMLSVGLSIYFRRGVARRPERPTKETLRKEVLGLWWAVRASRRLRGTSSSASSPPPRLISDGRGDHRVRAASSIWRRNWMLYV